MLNVCIRFFIYLLKHPLRLDVYRCAYVYMYIYVSSHWEVMCSVKRARHIIYVPYVHIQIFVFMLCTNV